MVQSLLEMEIGEVVGDQFVAQEGGELFVLLQKRVFEVGAEHVMAVLDAIDHGGQLAAHCAVQARAKTRRGGGRALAIGGSGTGTGRADGRPASARGGS